MSSKKAAKLQKKAAREADACAAELGAAAQAGNCAAITGMLDSGLIDVNALIEMKDKRGKSVATTALYWAVTSEQAAAAKLLLDRGANPNLANSSAIPLMGEGSLTLLRMLLEAKAELNAQMKATEGHTVQSIAGSTAFLAAAYCSEPRSGEMGLEMLNAAAAGDCGELERLIDGGFDIDATYASTRTGGMAMQATAPLAVRSAKDAAAARFLLDRGASPDLVACSTGHTPLMDAAAVGSLPIMQLLLEAKAEFDAADPTMGWTAFNTACAGALVHAACAEALAHARCGTSLQAANAGTLPAVPADTGPRDSSAAVLDLSCRAGTRARTSPTSTAWRRRCTRCLRTARSTASACC